MSLFLVVLLIYFDYYILIFLVEKFRDLSIQYVNFLAIGSSVLGFLVFTIFLANVRRRTFNFTVSGSVLGLSVLMLVASLTLPRDTVEVVGLVSLCTSRFDSNLQFSSKSSARSDWRTAFCTTWSCSRRTCEASRSES